jgi:MerR family redox-sensitive transcriptional activator SoxR
MTTSSHEDGASGPRRLLTLDEVAGRAGIEPAALHVYRTQGLLPPAQYVEGRPHYGVRVLRQLALIAIAEGSGIEAADLARLIPADQPSARVARERWAELAQLRLTELHGRHEAEAVQGCLECRCMNLSRCPLIASGRAGRASSVSDDY